MITTIFTSDSPQAVRIPKELRFDAKRVEIRRKGGASILRAIPEDNSWPEGYLESFGSRKIDDTFERLPQGEWRSEILMFLFDSDTCILSMKGDARVNVHFKKHGSKAVFVSSISFHELLYEALLSAAVERHLRAVSDFLTRLTVLPFSDSSAEYSSKIRQDLAAIGQTIGPLDTLIAGHALEHELTLVTGNTREFSRVFGLSLESWL